MAAAPLQEAEAQDDLTSSTSDSCLGAWASLFSSFTQQQAPLQKLGDMQGVLHVPQEGAAPVDPAAHQSAVFAALFNDLVSSQSHATSEHMQPTGMRSEHSSAVSLCDSAASFSFKTARQSHIHAGLHASDAADQPAVSEHKLSAADLDKQDLSITLQDWHFSADQASSKMITCISQQPGPAQKGAQTSLAQHPSRQIVLDRRNAVENGSTAMQHTGIQHDVVRAGPDSRKAAAADSNNDALMQPYAALVSDAGKIRQAHKRAQRDIRTSHTAQRKGRRRA